MRVLLIAGNDTGVGKTRAAGALAALFAGRGLAVQVVKPIETGVEDPRMGDAETALAACDGFPAGLVTAATLHRFAPPLAPEAAARKAGVDLDAATLAREIAALPEADVRLVEGAGGLATPIDAAGRDWADLAAALQAEATILVVENRLGAIGQARMLVAYASAKGLRGGVWLNERVPQDEAVRQATREGVDACGWPLWADQRAGERAPKLLDAGGRFCNALL